MARLTEARVTDRLAQLDGWTREGDWIHKVYQFDSFRSALAFVALVADRAEEADHHPRIVIDYNKVTLSLSTHSAGGLTDKDFDLAARIG